MFPMKWSFLSLISLMIYFSPEKLLKSNGLMFNFMSSNSISNMKFNVIHWSW